MVLVFRLEEELKPSSSSNSSNSNNSSALEEDEGFSDWSHRMENRGEQEVSEQWRRGPQTTASLEGKAEAGEEEQPEDEEEEGVKTSLVDLLPPADL